MWLFRRHLEEDESAIRIVHKHGLLGLKALFWPTVFLALSVSALALQPARALFIVLAGLTIILAVWWLRTFFDYFLDAWIVTDSGVIDIAWHGWFHRTSTRVLYSDIQGVSYEIKGVWGTLLRSGTISIEKISTGATISLEFVRRPRTVEALILRNMENYMHSKNLKNAKHVQDLLAHIVAERAQHEELSDEGQ